MVFFVFLLVSKDLKTKNLNGEKCLVYSFNHTQLLCYALMKLLLKGVIKQNQLCSDVLCSYFIKIILFWVSEETELTEWIPSNLISCFMKCFKRLIYFIENLCCPHYFISEINLFEKRITETEQEYLLPVLYSLFNTGWRCLLNSRRMFSFAF